MDAERAALIFANGNLTPGSMLEQTLAATPRAMVVAADGGAHLARRCGLEAQVVIGDMDSIEAAELARLQAAGAQMLRHPADKEETDLELALKWAVGQGCRVRCACSARSATGSTSRWRTCTCWRCRNLRDCDVQLVDGRQRAWLLRPGAHEIQGAAGDTRVAAAADGPGAGHRHAGAALGVARRDACARPGARRQQRTDCQSCADLRFSAGLLLVVHTQGRA